MMGAERVRMETPRMTRLYELLHQSDPDIEAFLGDVMPPLLRGDPVWEAKTDHLLRAVFQEFATPTSPEDFVPLLVEALDTKEPSFEERTRRIAKNLLGVLAPCSTLDAFFSCVNELHTGPYDWSAMYGGISWGVYHLLRLSSYDQHVAINVLKSFPLITGHGTLLAALPTSMEWLVEGTACLTKLLAEEMPRTYAHELAARFGSSLMYSACVGRFREGQLMRVVLPGDDTVVSLEGGAVVVYMGCDDKA